MEIETSCRSKAKEAAAEIYRGCVSDQKNAQIEQIKKEYQAKLQALKAHYDSELKKLSSAKAKAALEESATETAPAPSEKIENKKSDESGVNEAIRSPLKKASKTAVSKTPSAKMKMASAKKVMKKAQPVADASEMTVQLIPAPMTPPADESVMDLPEPIPMEDPVSDAAL